MTIYFYKEFGPLGYLANYSLHGFYKNGIYYKTVEHYYQSQKFLDENLRQKVIDASTPKEASNIGRDRNNKLRDNWSNIKQQIMLEGVLEKFRQNKDILIKLLNTGTAEIVEQTVDEYYWGCGKDKTGENNFGKILGIARERLREEQLKKIAELRLMEKIYVIGHDNLDVDAYFSSYMLAKILRFLGVKAYFTIMEDYRIADDSYEMIKDNLWEKPLVLNRKEITNEAFILVDHNDLMQSLGEGDYNVLGAIDHHIDMKQISDCYTVEYTSTLLYIYEMFKNVYNFSDMDKLLIALSVIADSEYLTSARFKESDRELYNELQVVKNVDEIRNKYFRTTDFNLDVNENLNNNYKMYNMVGKKIHRVLLKGYKRERKNLKEYLEVLMKKYENSLLIWNEYDTKKTVVYYEMKLVKKYDYILTSSVLIIKELLKDEIIK